MNWTHVAIALAVNTYALGGIAIGSVCIKIMSEDWNLMRGRYPVQPSWAFRTGALVACTFAVTCWPYFAWQWWGPRK